MLLEHRYFVFVEGLDIKARTFRSRVEAECFMHKICQTANIEVECTEQDKHERKYSNHKGIRFYINRI